jgi:hypothetical protein
VTIRNTIYVHPDKTITGRLLRHELAHVAQWDAHPWTFPLRYLWNHIHYGYHSNPFEVDARKAEKVGT